MYDNKTIISDKQHKKVLSILRKSTIVSVLAVPILLTGCAGFNKAMNQVQQFERAVIQAIWAGHNLGNIIRGRYGMLNNQKINSDYLVVKLPNGQDKLIPIKKTDAKNYTVGEEVNISINTNTKYPIIIPTLSSYKTAITFNTIKLRK